MCGPSRGITQHTGQGPASQDPDSCKQGQQSRPRDRGHIWPRSQISRQVHGDEEGQAGKSDYRSRSGLVRIAGVRHSPVITKAIKAY